MDVTENVPLGSKTTMRIGGIARYFVELKTKKDAEDVVIFAEEKGLPLVILGGGSNTIFADGTVEAVVARVMADAVRVAPHPPSVPNGYVRAGNPLPMGEGIVVHVEAGKILASLLGELAEQSLDLSPLTGIPGSVGGAVFGNAGQGFGGTWIGSFVKDVTFYYEKQWKTWAREECGFGYRESVFKKMSTVCHTEPVEVRHAGAMVRRAHHDTSCAPIIWEVTLCVPTRAAGVIKVEMDSLLQRRIETQPHLKTAGSCFKSLSDGTPAWKLIDTAGLRGYVRNNVQIAEKHANFLLNRGTATFADAVGLVEEIRSRVRVPLAVEMRFVGKDGRMVLWGEGN